MAVPQHPTGALPGQHGHGRRGQGLCYSPGTPSPQHLDHGPPPWPGCLHGGPSIVTITESGEIHLFSWVSWASLGGGGTSPTPPVPPRRTSPLSWEGLGLSWGLRQRVQSLRVEMVLEPPGLVLPRVSSPHPCLTLHMPFSMAGVITGQTTGISITWLVELILLRVRSKKKGTFRPLSLLCLCAQHLEQ